MVLLFTDVLVFIMCFDVVVVIVVIAMIVVITVVVLVVGGVIRLPILVIFVTV